MKSCVLSLNMLSLPYIQSQPSKRGSSIIHVYKSIQTSVQNFQFFLKETVYAINETAQAKKIAIVVILLRCVLSPDNRDPSIPHYMLVKPMIPINLSFEGKCCMHIWLSVLETADPRR